MKKNEDKTQSKKIAMKKTEAGKSMKALSGFWNGSKPIFKKIVSKTGKYGKSSSKQLLALTKEMKLNQVNKSVGTKLFLIIFASIVTCVLAVGLISYSQTKTIVERKVSGASFQTVSQVTTNLNIILDNYEEMTMQILINKDLHSLIGKMREGEDDYTRFEASRELSSKMQDYALGNSSIKAIYLLPLDDKLPVVTAGNASSVATAAMKQEEWFSRVQEANGKAIWLATQPKGFGGGSGAPTIGISRLLKDSTLNEVSYMLLIEINLASLQDSIKDVSLGLGSELSIVDGQNNYILPPNNDLIGQPAPVALPTEGDAAIEGSKKLETSDGQSMLTVYKSFDTVDWKLLGLIPVDRLVEDAKVIRDMTIITAIVAVFIAIAIGFLVIRTIAQPLMNLRNLMNEGQRGNLTVRSTIRKRSDEIGELSDSFNDMMTQITNLAKQATQSADTVLHTAGELTDVSRKTAISSREISVATEEIANGASSLAVEAERGSDLSGNISTQMETVKQANAEIVRAAGEVEKAGERGAAYMGELSHKTGQTEQMTRSMVEKVDSLKDSTGSIVKILDVLNNLTKQTNILSLNAAIEAARAGAAGKGFMVVADEIRKLADQSRQSIDIVGQITEKIQEEIDNTVSVLSDAYPLFQEQIVSVKQATDIFVNVQEQMVQFVHKLDSVTNSIGELDKSQEVLSEAMTNVSAVAQQSSATSEEVASLSSEQLSISDGLVSLSEELGSVSRELKDSLAKFKIE
ncbi:methyl-accepting chemotaxis protein [Paenibacillus sp. KS-LC4]|uniref:methyl-accepting chemotaxis protein n=2 Tax=Paenibacillus sp. KS-LC4 TaxID=2979727 RepID=UPI0030D4DE94